MSRRSTRLQSAANPRIPSPSLTQNETNGTSDEEEFQELEEPEEPEFVPKTKRRKIAKSTESPADDQKVKRVRGRRGILSSLREFPLDVIAEIFGHLNPMDLLNLARTTKEIRGILMTRSNAFIWKESRTQFEGLPDLPKDLCEPQYANLCFDIHCHKCLHPAQTIIWTARTRMCKKCIRENFDTWANVANETSLEQPVLLNLVPSFEQRRSGRRRYNTIQLFSIGVAEKLYKECAKFRTKGVLKTAEPEYTEWYKQKSDEMEETAAHSALCATWAENRTHNRKDELHDARTLRRDAIVERLTALGWGEDISFHSCDFNSHKLVKQPKELTNRIWKNIETPLVEFLTTLKQQRLQAAHVRIIKERRQLAAQVYSKFWETFPADTVFPAKVDMIRTEPFRKVIEDTSIHPEEKVKAESFDAAISQVQDFSVSWRKSKDQELVEIMKTSLPDAVEADLYLASTFFVCSRMNSEPIGYPRILVHSSATIFHYYSRDKDIEHGLQQALNEVAWNRDAQIKFNERAFHTVRSIVEACGLDPDVTTATEMDEINPVLECLNCGDIHGRLVMRWTQAASHNCDTPSWRCLNVEEEARVQAKENESFKSTMQHLAWSSWHESYCCSHCDDPLKTSFDKLRTHLETEHNINRDAVSLQDIKYAIDVGLSARHPRPVRLLPVIEKAETPEAVAGSGQGEVASVEVEMQDAEAESGAVAEEVEMQDVAGSELLP
ncbi:hypothetical protein C8R47DRAFT_1012074 [Mycena vitilis]|nr:hypothetical protein C8R47DRAFT_1012074 [Mycena vitilis]